MRIYLLGYMGSGKSTVGEKLARALGVPWIDLDAEIESKYKISIAGFFSKYGETAFREVEHKTLSDITLKPAAVISTGGGAPCFHNNMELMNASGITIYLEVSPEIILSRIGPHAHKRPLFRQMIGDNILEKIATHLRTREKYYRQAQMTVDGTEPDIEALKDRILNFRPAMP